mgnify:CR=1 FL=1
MLSKHLLVIFFINVILNFIVFSWCVVKNKNNCVCHNTQRLFIQFYSYFILIFIFLMFMLNYFNIIRYNSVLFGFILYFLFILQIFVIFYTIVLVKSIMKNKSNCDKTKYTFNYNDIFLGVTFIILFIIYFIISFIS